MPIFNPSNLKLEECADCLFDGAGDSQWIARKEERSTKDWQSEATMFTWWGRRKLETQCKERCNGFPQSHRYWGLRGLERKLLIMSSFQIDREAIKPGRAERRQWNCPSGIGKGKRERKLAPSCLRWPGRNTLCYKYKSQRINCFECKELKGEIVSARGGVRTRLLSMQPQSFMRPLQICPNQPRVT